MPTGSRNVYTDTHEENDASRYLRAQLRLDCTQMELGYSPCTEGKRHICNLPCKQMCSNLCLPGRCRTHSPQPSVTVLWSDQSLKGRGLELQRRQVRNAWETANSLCAPPPAKFLPYLICLICCCSLLGGEMQNLKIQFNRHYWTLNAHRYGARSCGCYRIEQIHHDL